MEVCTLTFLSLQSEEREVIIHSFKHIKHTKKLENHPNTSAITLLDNSEVTRRLKKNHVLDTEERSRYFEQLENEIQIGKSSMDDSPFK